MRDEYLKGMRRLVSGVSLITTALGGERHGLVATSVSSVSADPPTLLFSVNESASACAPLMRSGIACINVLAADQEAISRQFSASALREQRFTGGEWGVLRTGAPALARALATFDCRIVRQIRIHTHVLFIAESEMIAVNGTEVSPLAYFNAGYGTFEAGSHAGTA